MRRGSARVKRTEAALVSPVVERRHVRVQEVQPVSVRRCRMGQERQRSASTDQVRAGATYGSESCSNL
ncbi:hypothetical protein B8W95_14030, partial [Staphylococcus pasteuri]